MMAFSTFFVLLITVIVYKCSKSVSKTLEHLPPFADLTEYSRRNGFMDQFSQKGNIIIVFTDMDKEYLVSSGAGVKGKGNGVIVG